VTPAGGGEPRSWRPGALDWIFAVLSILYAFAVHHGIGPAPVRDEPRWFEPRGFLLHWDALTWIFASSGRAIAVLALPAAVLAAAALLAGRSALARGLALSALIATLLFVFYGNLATDVWELFHWRGSTVLALTSLAVGFALAAPWLAGSWLRLGWPARLAVYLPVCFAVIAFIRNATGTDPALRFRVSPWPAVPVFGIEVGALFAMACLAGGALGLAALAAVGRPAAARAAGILVALALPAALLGGGSALGLLPFRASAPTLVGASLACGLLIATAASLEQGGRPGVRRRRARQLAMGASLVALPLLLGEIWARWDYHRTRELRARRIIAAAERYLDREGVYPDDLQELVNTGLLGEIPEPAIGFGFLSDGSFEYRSFGTSFLLEFPAPRWVECAYTPPYPDEEPGNGDEPVASAGATTDRGVDGDSLGEAWSCPSAPPELW
jgi:hypothetical protein